MPTQPEFWDKVAAKYDKRTVKGPNYAARLERAARWLGPDASVLDVGCAGGQITLDLAERVRQVQGIDISEKLINFAGQRQKRQGVTNCSFEVTTAEDPRYVPGSFDGVTAYSLLHLVDDAPATVQRFHDLVRPGGRVIVEVPTTSEIGLHWRLLIRMMTVLGKAPVVRVYTQSDYLAMFEKAGLIVDEFKVYNPKSMNRSLLATRPA